MTRRQIRRGGGPCWGWGEYTGGRQTGQQLGVASFVSVVLVVRGAVSTELRVVNRTPSLESLTAHHPRAVTGIYEGMVNISICYIWILD